MAYDAPENDPAELVEALRQLAERRSAFWSKWRGAQMVIPECNEVVRQALAEGAEAGRELYGKSFKFGGVDYDAPFCGGRKD